MTTYSHYMRLLISEGRQISGTPIGKPDERTRAYRASVEKRYAWLKLNEKMYPREKHVFYEQSERPPGVRLAEKMRTEKTI